jgi:hypothetical protein
MLVIRSVLITAYSIWMMLERDKRLPVCGLVKGYVRNPVGSRLRESEGWVKPSSPLF